MLKKTTRASMRRPSGGQLVLASLALTAMVVCGFSIAPTSASAEEHRVRRGQNLARIAKRYNVQVGDLAAANRMRRTDALREGQILTIPERGIVYVGHRQSLTVIASRNNVTVAALARANGLSPSATLRVGQRLVLPGHRASKRAVKRWGTPRRPGVINLYRVINGEQARVRVLSKRGRVRRRAREQVGQLLRHRTSNRTLSPNRRLLRLMTQISDHFGGRRLNIISGYRPAGNRTEESSRHVSGSAIDFSVAGVNLRAIRDYCRSLPDVGVGFYPRARFIHLDVRDESVYWVDQSARGERARVTATARGRRPLN